MPERQSARAGTRLSFGKHLAALGESEERERESGCLSDIIINASGRVRTSGEFTVDNEPSRGEDESARHSGRAPRTSKSLHSTNDRWSRWKDCGVPVRRGERRRPQSTINNPRLHYSSAWKNICRSMLRRRQRDGDRGSPSSPFYQLRYLFIYFTYSLFICPRLPHARSSHAAAITLHLAHFPTRSANRVNVNRYTLAISR